MKTKSELVEMLNNHDCHLSEMDGCQCVEIREDLEAGRYANTVPYKFHSKLRKPPFIRDLEYALWQEVREDLI